jgi:hypothetical protein
MAGSIGRIGITVPDLDGLIHDMIEVLERIFQPFDFRKCDRHMHADLQEGVADADRDPEFGGRPPDAHDIGHLTVDIQDVSSVGFQKQPFALQIQAGRRREPIFLAVDPESVNLFDPGSEQRVDI